MNKLRLALVALSVFALAGLTACDNDDNAAQPAKSVSPKKKDDGNKDGGEGDKAEKVNELDILVKRSTDLNAYINKMTSVKGSYDETCNEDQMNRLNGTIVLFELGEARVSRVAVNVILEKRQIQESPKGPLSNVSEKSTDDEVAAAAHKLSSKLSKVGYHCTLKFIGDLASQFDAIMSDKDAYNYGKDAYKERISRKEAFVNGFKSVFDSAYRFHQSNQNLETFKSSVETIQKLQSRLEIQVEILQNSYDEKCYGDMSHLTCHPNYQTAGSLAKDTDARIKAGAEFMSLIEEKELDEGEMNGFAADVKAIADAYQSMFDTNVELLKALSGRD